MDSLLKFARYKPCMPIKADEVLNSSLYGPDKYALMFDLIRYGSERDNEFRVSLGQIGTQPLWAVMLFGKEVRIEITYLDQDAVEAVLQTISNEFGRRLKLISNANFMALPSSFEPGETVVREV